MDVILERVLELLGRKHGATKELADSIGISGGAITNWKNGHSKSYRQYLPQIADYYGVSLDWLSGRSDQKTTKDPANVSIDGVRERVITRLCQLSPEDFALVDAFVQGLIAKHQGE